ncbi:hypothetical protein KEM54_001165, partial [Ascosphaera aggregata]
ALELFLGERLHGETVQRLTLIYMTPFATRMYDTPVVNGTEVFALPPPGYQVNFDNPRQIHHDAHIVIFAVGGFIASIAILQRFYTKIFLANGLQVDDRFFHYAPEYTYLASGGQSSRPVRLGYDVWLRKQAENARCIDPARLYLTIAGMNILTDFALFVLPVPMILKLRLSKAQKAGAIIIFAIGSLTLCTSCVRCVFITRIIETSDPPWDGALADAWTFAESNLFIVCGSTPTLRKFFQHFFPRLMLTVSSRHSSNQSSNPHNSNGRTNVNPSTVDDILLGDILEVSTDEDHNPHAEDAIYEVINTRSKGSSKVKRPVNVCEKPVLEDHGIYKV